MLVERRHPPASTSDTHRRRALTRVLSLLLLLALVASAAPTGVATAQGGLRVESLESATLSPESLAQSLAGAGVSVEPGSVSYIGSPVGAGQFTGGAAAVSVDAGIVLSSGKAVDVEGPNDTPDKSTNLGVAGDEALTNLAGGQTFDASILEFSFTVSGGADTVYFQYIFGSEEYHAFVGSSFNDVFAFFVNGENCAIVGSPPQPVAVNTINSGRSAINEPASNRELFINNSPFHETDITGTPVPESQLRDTQMNGFTVPLECRGSVQPGTNTLRLAIADTADRRLDSWVLIAAETLSTEPPPPPNGTAPPTPTDPDRVAGGDRIGTSVEISQVFDSADEVLLARSDEYADALAGAPLAASIDAPILLTPRHSLADEVGEEIQRLGAQRVRLLGGTTALFPRVEQDVRSMGLVAQRYRGANRFDTARLIARDVPNPNNAAYVVEGINADRGRGWPDAVSVSALAAFTQTPILLTRRDSIPDETVFALADPEIAASRAVIVGGTAAVSQPVESFVGSIVGNTQRVAGRTRYETSAEIANLSIDSGMRPRNTWVATGRSFPDALAAAPVAGSTAPGIAAEAGVMLLVDGLDLERSRESRWWLQAQASEIERIRAVGGQAVISNATLSAIRDAAAVN